MNNSFSSHFCVYNKLYKALDIKKEVIFCLNFHDKNENSFHFSFRLKIFFLQKKSLIFDGLCVFLYFCLPYLREK